MSVIELRQVSKEYRSGFLMKKVKALDNLTLSIEEGETFGYIGPNGAGKTTTFKILMGLIYPTSGTVRLFERDIRDITVKQSIGFLPEAPYFYDYLTAGEFLDFYGQLFQLERNIRRKRIDELLDLVDLSRARTLRLRQFSKGMLQRIGIAQALINDPQLIILDEPMSGLDPLGRIQIRDIILLLKKRRKTIIFSTHILSDVEQICDRVGILVGGKLRDLIDLDHLLQERVKFIEIVASDLGESEIKRVKAIAREVTMRDELQIIRVNSEQDRDEIFDIIRVGQGRMISMIPHYESLEDLLLEEIKRR
ncbi:MAG: ABC transporter ATP-binding protein [Candidatus Tectomicrobia bacterium]|nr:ABC transporter ATP-binding protein [Candidatus Tectomicrobia bacterium]